MAAADEPIGTLAVVTAGVHKGMGLEKRFKNEWYGTRKGPIEDEVVDRDMPYTIITIPEEEPTDGDED